MDAGERSDDGERLGTMTTQRYSLTARVLHWGSAAVILWASVSGFAVSGLPAESALRASVAGCNAPAGASGAQHGLEPRMIAQRIEIAVVVDPVLERLAEREAPLEDVERAFADAGQGAGADARGGIVRLDAAHGREIDGARSMAATTSEAISACSAKMSVSSRS